MALTRYLTKGLDNGGFGQLELNQVAFRRDGRIEAQCALDTTDFSEAAPAENGMILAVDKVNNLIKLPTGDSGELYALNYTTEYMYDERANALKDFKLVPGTFLPRLGYLAKGDRFTTNCLCYDNEEEDGFATDAAVETALKAYATTPVYGKVSTTGAIKLTPAAGTGLTLQVAKYYTMPDGTPGVKFIVIED